MTDFMKPLIRQGWKGPKADAEDRKAGERNPFLGLPAVAMKCDAGFCLDEVRRAPRIIIPSKMPFEPGHDPIRMMTTLHFCEAHRFAFNLAAYWTDKEKASVERRAKEIRPHGFKPDFEAASIELVLVTTPEYRAFLHAHGLDHAAV